MVDTFSWPCRDCGEFNVVDLRDRPTSDLRCDFCLKPLQTYPSFAPEPRMRLSDDWLGDEILKPLFGSARTEK